LHLEALWDRNITITTRLVNTVSTPMLFKIVRSGRLVPDKLLKLLSPRRHHERLRRLR
jgi:alcohol dehydrogenase